MVSAPTIGELFAGYGGLGDALTTVFGARVAWLSEIDRAASTVLAARFPGVPNHGDITKIDWRAVEPVDIICGGSPCQDMSHVGKRGGMKDGTRSGLWSYMRDAIEIIRPRLVVWENVRGATSSEADSDVEPCPWCVGDEPEATMRALGRVLADLADLGFDARWYGLRAADVGAPHGRFRIFLFATPADAGGGRRNGRAEGVGGGRLAPVGIEAGDHLGDSIGAPRQAVALGVGSSPTPVAYDWKDRSTTDAWRGNDLVSRVKTLPTPSASDGAGGKVTLGGARSGEALLGGIDRLLPTPTAMDSVGARNSTATRSPDAKPFVLGDTLGDIAYAARWGDYAPAIARWERVIGRAAPEPIEKGAKGQPRLSPAFVEWMMGLPAGHVTDPALGVKRNDQLKMLGNGVVPQQAIAAALAFVADEAREANP